MSINVVNMSFSMKPGCYNKTNENIIAIKQMIYRGIQVVVSAGNYGPICDTLSPLSLVNGVISVGAASIDGKFLAEFSSRGIPGDPLIHPTVVAPGINVLIPNDQPNYNEFNRSISDFNRYHLIFQGDIKKITRKELKYYQPFSGTSAACPVVSAIIIRIIQMREILNLQHDTGIIMELIEEIAQPMAGYKRHEVGAGFISPAVVKRYFKQIDNNDIMIKSKHWNNHQKLERLWDICLG